MAGYKANDLSSPQRELMALLLAGLPQSTPGVTFNRLCAIILAKLIDEERAPDAILDFQWFPDKDTAEDLIDRL